MTTDEEAQPFLEEFNEGFSDGWAGRERQKNRSGTYRNAYDKGRKAKSDYDGSRD